MQLMNFTDFNKNQLKRIILLSKDDKDDKKSLAKKYLFLDKPNNFGFYSVPILNYDSTQLNNFSESVFNDKGIVFYNNPWDINKVSSKVNFHKIFGNSKFIPNTVLNDINIDSLSFPIICKPEHGHSGIGIKKFNTKEDYLKNNEKFDVYQECKNIDQEFRLFIFDNNIFKVYKKTTNSQLNGKKLDFDYVNIHENIDFNLEFGLILSELKKKIDFLKYYCVDVIKTDDNKFYILEINSQPGVIDDILIDLYIKIYEDYYNEKITQKTHNYLNSLRPIFNEK
jgi:glutathione synthase/RimK-type ligase-like ATP-grasp enzyme